MWEDVQSMYKCIQLLVQVESISNNSLVLSLFYMLTSKPIILHN